MPIRRNHTATERDGINYVRNIIEHANSIFNEIHLENDYGNDAFIELVDGEDVTGVCLVLQVKSGVSYCKPDTCTIPASAEHFKYWRDHRLTVVGIVYDPNEMCAYWTDISTYLKQNPRLVHDGPYRITFPKQLLSRFDDDGFRDIFLPMFLDKPILLDFQRSSDLAYSNSFHMHSVGIMSLFYGFRNDEQTWDIFEDILRNREPTNTTAYLAYVFAHIPGHGDIFWHEHNIIEKEIREKIKLRMEKYERDIMLPLICQIDENGFSRGSVGQNVYAIVDLTVANSSRKLAEIIQDHKVELEARNNALTLYCLMEQENADTFLRHVRSMCPELSNWAEELLAHLQQEGFFYTD